MDRIYLKKQNIFIEAWSIAISWLFRASACMTAVAMLALIGAGAMTAVTVGNGLVDEGNLPLAKIMAQYGNFPAVTVFGAEILLIIFAVYKATKFLAKRNAYAKTFHALLMTFILIMAVLDFCNDALLTLNMTDAWNRYFSGFQKSIIVKELLWHQRSETAPRYKNPAEFLEHKKSSDFFCHDTVDSTFTTALYNGTHLIDTVIECQNEIQINSYPTSAMIYVGESWHDPYPERESAMRC